MINELKPCPFCGCEASINSDCAQQGEVPHYWALCDNDDCDIESFTKGYYEEQKAIDKWNTRAPINKDQAIKDSLEQHNDKLRGEHD